MKHICITYHMSIDHSKPSDNYPHNIETAETCITLAMKDEIADDILKNQEESVHVRKGSLGIVRLVLDYSAEMQGYTEADFVCAEHDEDWIKIDSKN